MEKLIHLVVPSSAVLLIFAAKSAFSRALLQALHFIVSRRSKSVLNANGIVAGEVGVLYETCFVEVSEYFKAKEELETVTI